MQFVFCVLTIQSVVHAQVHIIMIATHVQYLCHTWSHTHRSTTALYQWGIVSTIEKISVNNVHTYCEQRERQEIERKQNFVMGGIVSVCICTNDLLCHVQPISIVQDSKGINGRIRYNLTCCVLTGYGIWTASSETSSTLLCEPRTQEQPMFLQCPSPTLSHFNYSSSWHCHWKGVHTKITSLAPSIYVLVHWHSQIIGLGK